MSSPDNYKLTWPKQANQVEPEWALNPSAAVCQFYHSALLSKHGTYLGIIGCTKGTLGIILVLLFLLVFWWIRSFIWLPFEFLLLISWSLCRLDIGDNRLSLFEWTDCLLVLVGIYWWFGSWIFMMLFRRVKWYFVKDFLFNLHLILFCFWMCSKQKLSFNKITDYEIVSVVKLEI